MSKHSKHSKVKHQNKHREKKFLAAIKRWQELDAELDEVQLAYDEDAAQKFAAVRCEFPDYGESMIRLIVNTRINKDLKRKLHRCNRVTEVARMTALHYVYGRGL